MKHARDSKIIREIRRRLEQLGARMTVRILRHAARIEWTIAGITLVYRLPTQILAGAAHPQPMIRAMRHAMRERGLGHLLAGRSA